jgi:alpha-galactosidase
MSPKQEIPSLTRREALRLAVATPFISLLPAPGSAAPARGLSLDVLAKAPSRVVPLDAGVSVDKIVLTREWQGPLCRSKVTNTGKLPVRIKEIVVADVSHDLAPDTRLYGEGFQMLSQTGGTVGKPEKLGSFTDREHYKIPMPADAADPAFAAVYGLVTLAPPSAEPITLAFSSCRRFNGQFFSRPGSLQAVVDAEGLELAPGETWELEEIVFLSGTREATLPQLAEHLNRNHPPLKLKEPPSGWCSWYCFGAAATAQQILDNLDYIAKNIPSLKYIQIDDGYQPFMGDWLDTGEAFGTGVQDVLKKIRERGFEPAIWVAPFIAEEGSKVYQEHPDWFVKDDDGMPLSAAKVTFAGWRKGPWYMLDGSHPEVQKHYEHVFRTMREEWGCTYFKLDANTWGAMHGGRRHDPKATRVEAYRRGMEAVIKGAGDAFILGCNHPIWASLGLVHGSRSSNDINRTWGRTSAVAKQNLLRAWQNGRLWWNDPDAVVLMPNRGKTLTDDEYRFHATSIYATGGMILSGDDLTSISPEALGMLRKLQPPTGIAARWEDDSLQVGVVDLPGKKAVCLLNWEDAPKKLTFALKGAHVVQDMWSGEDRGKNKGEMTVELPAHGGTVLLCTPV